jgi:glycosyltransferase involved in cell wall biosynthesis
VIGTSVGGTVEIVTDSLNGFLYKPGDIEHLKKCITHFIQNPKDAELMGLNAYKVYQEKFLTNGYFVKSANIIKKCKNKKPSFVRRVFLFLLSVLFFKTKV